MRAVEHYGIMLRDTEGNTWFCGGDSSVFGRPATGEEELTRVVTTNNKVSDALDRIDRAGPAQGKFLMVPGDPLQLELIEWWEPVLPERPVSHGEGQDAELRALLARITSRVACAGDQSPEP